MDLPILRKAAERKSFLSKMSEKLANKRYFVYTEITERHFQQHLQRMEMNVKV